MEEIMNIEDLEIKRDTIIDDEVILLEYNDTVLFSSNNLSIINGLKGSMKSTARDYLLRQLLKPEEGFKSDFKGDIMIIDTEMSKRLVKKSVERFTIAGVGPDRVRFFSLKGISVNDMASTTEKLIERFNPTVVALDGTRDYCLNSNDPTESMQLTNQLLYWVNAYKIHIINIVHSVHTANGSKTKGTFGSELENKAETIISMTKSHNKAQVKNTFSRETLPFKSFNITLNENNTPIIA